MNPVQETQKLVSFVQRTGWDNILLATDMDGTALDYADNPADVVIPPALRTAANDAFAATRGHFAVITGRDAHFIDHTVFPDAKYPLSAEHHAQARMQGEAHLRDLVTAPDWTAVDTRLKQGLRNLAEVFNGVFLEDGKRFSRVLHWRGVADEHRDKAAALLAPLAQEAAQNLTQATGTHFDVKQGAMAFEIGPHAANKRTALTDFLNRARLDKGAETVAIYAGDSGPDMDAGLYAQMNGGLFISVGPDTALRAKAGVSFDTPTQYLAALHTALATTQTPRHNKPARSLTT